MQTNLDHSTCQSWMRLSQIHSRGEQNSRADATDSQLEWSPIEIVRQLKWRSPVHVAKSNFNCIFLFTLLIVVFLLFYGAQTYSVFKMLHWISLVVNHILSINFIQSTIILKKNSLIFSPVISSFVAINYGLVYCLNIWNILICVPN